MHDDGSGERSGNHRSVVRYLADADAGRFEPAERHALSAADLAADRIWLGLRTSDGIPRGALPASASAELTRLVTAGLLTVDDARIRPSARGLLFADEVGARLADGL